MAGKWFMLSSVDESPALVLTLVYGFWVVIWLGPVLIWALVTRMFKEQLDLLEECKREYEARRCAVSQPGYLDSVPRPRVELRGRILEIREGYQARYTGWIAVFYFGFSALYATTAVAESGVGEAFNAVLFAAVFVAAGGWFTYFWGRHRRRANLGQALVQRAKSDK